MSTILTILTILIPLISLILAILPFWYIRKKFGVENLKARHIAIAYFIALVLIIILNILLFELSDFALKNIRNYDPVIDSIENGLILSWLVLIISSSISPFLIIKYLKRKFTLKNGIISSILAIIILVTLILTSLVFVAWGATQAFQNLDSSNVFNF